MQRFGPQGGCQPRVDTTKSIPLLSTQRRYLYHRTLRLIRPNATYISTHSTKHLEVFDADPTCVCPTRDEQGKILRHRHRSPTLFPEGEPRKTRWFHGRDGPSSPPSMVLQRGELRSSIGIGDLGGKCRFSSAGINPSTRQIDLRRSSSDERKNGCGVEIPYDGCSPHDWFQFFASQPEISRGCAHFFLAACFLTYLVFFFFCRSLFGSAVLLNSQSNK